MSYKIAQVRFVKGNNTTKEYAFRLYDPYIVAGDFVLTDSANNYVVAQVVEITDSYFYVGTQPTKDIICRVDFTEYNKRQRNRDKEKELLAAMENRVKENPNLTLYRAIAKNDPVMKSLLDNYDSIISGDENKIKFDF